VSNLPAEFVEISTICKATEVVIGGRTVMGVADARALHEGLSVGWAFGAWLPGRIDQYGFQEGSDYEVISRSGKNPKGGRPENIYRLTLDMAKELAMVENNEAGRVARRYFIWAEELARRLTSGDLTQDNRAIIGGIVKETVNKALEPIKAKFAAG
jgi:anti-repressor protein